jgi:hypothetical protein
MRFWRKNIGRSGIRIARPVADFPNQHRLLTPQLDLAAILSHVEERVIGNDYTISFAGHRYQIARAAAQAGMRRQQLRVELRLDGELKARYQGRYVEIGECGTRAIAPAPKTGKPVRKDHNAGGRSNWMQASLIGPVHRCGSRSELEREKPLGTPGKSGPAIFAF